MVFLPVDRITTDDHSHSVHSSMENLFNNLRVAAVAAWKDNRTASFHRLMNHFDFELRKWVKDDDK